MQLEVMTNLTAPSAPSIAFSLRRAISALCLSSLLVACNFTSPPAPTPKPQQAQLTTRPIIPPPPVRVFHDAAGSITLVTKPNATDDEITSLIWQLRDAAHTHTFDKLKISQKTVDARSPSVWFHIYRGPKCASEKYASGPPPCGPSYHAAGDYTFGGYNNPNWDDGLLLHDENHEVPLWNPDTPYTPQQPTP